MINGVSIVVRCAGWESMSHALPSDQTSFWKRSFHVLRPAVAGRSVEEIANDQRFHNRAAHRGSGSGFQRPQKKSRHVTHNGSQASVSPFNLRKPPLIHQVGDSKVTSQVQSPNSTLLQIGISKAGTTRRSLSFVGMTWADANVVLGPGAHTFHETEAVQNHRHCTTPK
eukprot:Skav203181  [mRNA]  locus=scaffold39:214057:219846:- [translate_table: standard]